MTIATLGLWVLITTGAVAGAFMLGRRSGTLHVGGSVSLNGVVWEVDIAGTPASVVLTATPPASGATKGAVMRTVSAARLVAR